LNQLGAIRRVLNVHARSIGGVRKPMCCAGLHAVTGATSQLQSCGMKGGVHLRTPEMFACGCAAAGGGKSLRLTVIQQRVYFAPIPQVS
jgi:hypothetical protein